MKSSGRPERKAPCAHNEKNSGERPDVSAATQEQRNLLGHQSETPRSSIPRVLQGYG